MAGTLPGLVIASTLFLITTFGAGTVGAQPDSGADTDQRLLTCDAIEDPGDRLACFNDIVESLKARHPMTTDPAPTTRSVDDAATVAAAGSAQMTATPAQAVTTAAVVEAPQAQEGGDQDSTGSSVIVRVWKNLDGRFSVELDNGETWRETEGTRVGMPDVGDKVEISQGAFGSYRMKIEGISRVAWVRRTK